MLASKWFSPSFTHASKQCSTSFLDGICQHQCNALHHRLMHACTKALHSIMDWCMPASKQRHQAIPPILQLDCIQKPNENESSFPKMSLTIIAMPASKQCSPSLIDACPHQSNANHHRLMRACIKAMLTTMNWGMPGSKQYYHQLLLP